MLSTAATCVKKVPRYETVVCKMEQINNYVIHSHHYHLSEESTEV